MLRRSTIAYVNINHLQVGPHASGKTSLVHLVAHLAGHQLDVLNTNSSMDTTELLGGFEQVT